MLKHILEFLDELPIGEEIRTVLTGRRKHDAAKFAEMDAILSEVVLTMYLDGARLHTFHGDVLDPVDAYFTWTRLTGNQFEIPSLFHQRRLFDSALGEFAEFTSNHFFPSDRNSALYVFLPEQDPTRNLMLPSATWDYFDKQAAELERLARLVSGAYAILRRLITQKLHV